MTERRQSKNRGTDVHKEKQERLLDMIPSPSILMSSLHRRGGPCFAGHACCLSRMPAIPGTASTTSTFRWVLRESEFWYLCFFPKLIQRSL